MKFTTFPIGWLAAFAVVGIAAAQLPGIDVSTGARGGTDAVSPPRESGSLKNAVELCERLAGVEREICLKQARENRERALAPDVGATPNAGSGGTAPGNVPRTR